MQIYKFPEKNEWPQIVTRPAMNALTLEKKVREILDKVKAEGDAAVRAYTKQFDGTDITGLRVSIDEINESEELLDHPLRLSMLRAAMNIQFFHEKQISPVEVVQSTPGVQCWRKSVGIEKVGLYIPGGTAPLFSTLLMLGIPAVVAGCEEIIVCSPPGKDGNIPPAILNAARLIGIKTVFKAGGVQAIAAMAYGTETIPRVYKIFGPGNQFVTCAKQLIQKEGIAIDMPAGPSEIAIYADETAIPAFVAADLLSQAEHGPDSQVLLVVTDPTVSERVSSEIQQQLQELPRKEIAAHALKNGKIVIVKNETEAIELLNEFAAEHLILNCFGAEAVAEKIINAGSVFLGNYSPESVGDYASGPNHVLPTNGYARAYSGVSLDSFVKKITFQKVTYGGLKNIGGIVQELAEAEGLTAHKNAVTVRLNRPENEAK